MALDIDECLNGNGGCTQNCNNTAGSYQCYCDEGYELSNDDHTCVGKSLATGDIFKSLYR